MPAADPMHIAFIFNPKAGRVHNIELVRKIEQRFADRPNGHTGEVILTDRSGHASDLAAELAARYRERLVVFACGGDGTANEVANEIAGTSSAMSVLPIGTANDFARTSLTETNPVKLIEKAIYPQIRPIDVIQVDDRICLNIASMGFDTKVQNLTMAIIAKFRWLGSLAYPLGIFLAIFGKRDYSMHYLLDSISEQGEEIRIEGDAVFILSAICNGRYYGGGYNPAPTALIDDGLLNFSLIDALPLRRILPLIPKYKKGLHLSDPAVHTWQVTGGRIAASSGKLLGNMDGEPFEKEEITFKVISNGLNFAFY